MLRFAASLKMACALAAAAMACQGGGASGRSPDDSEAQRLSRVRSLRAPLLSGTVPTYYTPGYDQHARILQGLLTGEQAFAVRGSRLTCCRAVTDSRRCRGTYRWLTLNRGTRRS